MCNNKRKLSNAAYAEKLLKKVRIERLFMLIIAGLIAISAFAFLACAAYEFIFGQGKSVTINESWVFTILAAFLYGVFWGIKRIENNRALRMGHLQDIILYKSIVEAYELEHEKALELLVRTRRTKEIQKLVEAENEGAASIAGGPTKPGSN